MRLILAALLLTGCVSQRHLAPLIIEDVSICRDTRFLFTRDEEVNLCWGVDAINNHVFNIPCHSIDFCINSRGRD